MSGVFVAMNKRTRPKIWW